MSKCNKKCQKPVRTLLISPVIDNDHLGYTSSFYSGSTLTLYRAERTQLIGTMICTLTWYLLWMVVKSIFTVSISEEKYDYKQLLKNTLKNNKDYYWYCKNAKKWLFWLRLYEKRNRHVHGPTVRNTVHYNVFEQYSTFKCIVIHVSMTKIEEIG